MKKINYQCQLGTSDHILIEFEINEDREEEMREEHINGRYYHGKVDFDRLSKYFIEM